MAGDVFSRIVQDASRQPGAAERSVEDSRKWFRSKAREISSMNHTEFMRNAQDRYRNQVVPGHMYCFYYDPKWKKELPYYDRFPMIFPIKMEGDRFLGINLHYLPYNLRAKLMDALYSLETSGAKGQRKLQISYNILKNAAKFSAFKPCIKEYLKSHVRSRFVKIDHSEWDIAVMLPLERFEKATKAKVWAESKKIIEGKK